MEKFIELAAGVRPPPADGDDADRARALTLRDQALAIAREIGLKPLTERIIARKKILKA